MQTGFRFRVAGWVVAALLLAGAPALADTLMTFEEFIGNDSANIGSYYTGVTFTTGGSGSDWKARDTVSGSYNISSWPSGTSEGTGDYWIYGSVGATTALDSSGNDGRISFDNGDATYVELGYSAGSTLSLRAYDSSNNLLDTDSGAANLRFSNSNSGGPGTLRVDWNGTDYIKYVVVSDTGNFWIVDNVKTDATGIQGVVPLPPAALMGFGLLGGLGVVRRFRRR